VDENGEFQNTWELLDGICFESRAFEVAREAGLPQDMVEEAEQLWQRMLAGEVGGGQLKSVPGALTGARGTSNGAARPAAAGRSERIVLRLPGLHA
jgi:DNA mismatch repair ATPase MutS